MLVRPFWRLPCQLRKPQRLPVRHELSNFRSFAVYGFGWSVKAPCQIGERVSLENLHFLWPEV